MKSKASKAKSVRVSNKKLSVVATKRPKKIRLAVECTPEERKYIKMIAAHEDQTINEFVLSCVWKQIGGCPNSHIPNEETAAALDASERGKGIRSHKSIEEMFKFLGI